MDDKVQAAIAKLLSPAGKDVRTVRLPPVEAEMQGSEQFLQQLAGQGVSCSSSSWPGCAGWKQFTSPEGKKYYHHAPSQTTTWDPPPGMYIYIYIYIYIHIYIYICIYILYIYIL